MADKDLEMYSLKRALELKAQEIKEGYPKINFDRPQNQEIKADKGKLEISLVPMEIVRNIASIRMYGNKKYPKNTWRQVEIQRYIDAMDRHMLLFNDNPYGVDEESGMPHLWHIACNVAFLCELMKGKFDDSKKE